MSAGEGWIKTQLGEVATLVKGISYASEDYCGPGEGAVFITIKCVSKAGGFKREGIKYFKGTIASSQVLQPSELLIANTDLTRAGDIVGCPMLVPTINGETITMSMDLSKIVEDDAKVDRNFLYYMLMTDPVRRFMKDHASGSTVLHLQTRAVPGLELEIPTSKPEQTKIAEILSTVDRAIEQTEALIAKQQRIKTGLMQDLLTRGIDEHGNLRSEQTHEFKDSLIKGVRIPISWIDGEFRKVTSVNQGLQIPIEKRFKEEGPNRHKYITVQYLNNPDKYLEYIEKPPFQLVCSEGDILFTRTGNTGQIITGVEGVYHNNFFKVAYDKTKVYGDYLVQFLNWQPIQELIRERAGTTTIPDLNHGDFYSLPLFLPQINEQKLINELLRTQNADLSTESRKLAKLRSLKTALMQDLLTGRKRVTALLNDTEEITS